MRCFTTPIQTIADAAITKKKNGIIHLDTCFQGADKPLCSLGTAIWLAELTIMITVLTTPLSLL